MRYKDLKHIVNKRIKFLTNRVPQNSLDIAKQLHLTLKRGAECKKDLGEDNYPLGDRNAILVLRRGKYIIYYDEKHRYKNFSVAHEVAHYLLDHTSDGVKQHLDAQLMAAIIVAPSEYIHGIKSAQELAGMCKIPIDVAENYWYELEEAGEIEAISGARHKFFAPKIAHTTIVSMGIIAFLLAIIGFMGFHQMSLSNNIGNATQPTETVSGNTITVPAYSDALELDTVYVTPTGDKFHYKDCRHIQGADHIFEMMGYEAIQAGYEPCKDCIG